MTSERGDGILISETTPDGEVASSRPSAPGQHTICLDVDDLADVVAAVGLDRFVDDLIAAIAGAVRSFDIARVETLARAGFSYTAPAIGLVEWMPSMVVGRSVAIKTVAYHPDNPSAVGLPSVLATTSVYDTDTGRLVAICEATMLTALRTGAASAVMTDALVPPGPITLGVVGCGAQAVTQIHAISRIRPIERLIVADAEPAVAATLADRLPPGVLVDGAAFDVVSTLAFGERVGDLDVLCTCTSVDVDKGPVVELRGAKPALHVNAVGSDFPGKVELPVDYLRSAVVIPDTLDQCLVEGESQQLTADEVGPGMVEVLTDPAHRELVNQRTVFDSTGWAYEDLVAATRFVDEAERLGLGTRLALQYLPDDPYDPLEAIRRRNRRRGEAGRG
ncbi:MAG: ornithine cyclodeaminase family protein [Actinomycetota bacterium]